MIVIASIKKYNSVTARVRCVERTNEKQSVGESVEYRHNQGKWVGAVRGRGGG